MFKFKFHSDWIGPAAKTNYNAKPKLKICTPEIKSALRIKRAKYEIWKDNGKPMDINSIICKEKKESKKEFRRCIRVRHIVFHLHSGL
jgi:hypothetical protein